MDRFPGTDCFDEQMEALGIINPTLVNCMTCGKEFFAEKPVVCCTGASMDCGCMGMPELIVCSNACFDNFKPKSSKPTKLELT